MQIVIDIPEEIYKDIVKNGFIYDEDNEIVTHVIKNGIPLPKGHGKLIDADAVDIRYSDPEVVETLDDAPTIIEADKKDNK
jgi:hypothetical protein